MSEQDQNAAQMEKAEIVLGVVLVAHHQAPEIVQPGEEPFDFPAAAVAPQRPAILGAPLRTAIAAVRCNHLCPVRTPHLFIQRVAIVSFVANQALGEIGDETLLHGLGYQLYFSWRSTRCAY